jgi:inner membrane protein involved in colicin E2 resistance
MKNTSRSFHFAVISSVILGLFIILANTDRTQANNINEVTSFFITLFMTSVLLGVFFSVKSVRDAHHWKKYFSIGLNLFYFLLLILSLSSNLRDVVRVFG